MKLVVVNCCQTLEEQDEAYDCIHEIYGQVGYRLRVGLVYSIGAVL